jgi:hypothetical protein
METLQSYGTQAWNQSLSFLSSNNLISQLVLTVIIILVIHFLIVAVESLVTGIQNYSHLSATLLKDTYVSKGGSTDNIVIRQGNKSEHPFIYPSENEVNGIEFTYSFHLYIDPENYSSERTTGTNTKDTTFRPIFYKGSDVGPWPILGPGVFLNAKQNTIRVYMNTITQTKEEYVEVPNVPVGKWFHMVLIQKGQNMDVYINGNIAVRNTFSTIPRINYGDVYVFPDGTTDKNIYPNTDTTDADVKFNAITPMQGMISRLKYFAYALSFSQIDSLYGEGASKEIKSTSFDFKPPYLHDSWWVTRYNPMSAHYGL